MAEIENRASGRFKQNKLNLAIFNTAFIILLILLFTTAYFRNTVWEDDVVLWEDVLGKIPENASGHKAMGHHDLGIAYHEQGRLDEAIREYLIALRISPSFTTARNNLGKVYFRQGRLDDAVKEYLFALEIDPTNAEVHNNLGNAYFRQGRLDDAVKEYLFALDFNPSYTYAHYNIGFVYRMKGLEDKAKKEFKTALKLEPDFTPAQKALEILDKSR